MKGKKQTKKWSYSPLGKGFRGFLCMVTFCVFCVSAAFMIYAVDNYGVDIITKPKDSYYETDMYQYELHVEMNNILSHIVALEEDNIPNDTLAILHMSDGKIHYYDEQAIGETLQYNYDFGHAMEDIAGFEVNEPKAIDGVDLYDFEELKAFLASKDIAIDYVYYNQSAFVKLFEEEGLLNTNQRFSEDFSEDAYFVFKNYEVTKKKSSQEVEETNEETTTTEQSNVLKEKAEESTISSDDQIVVETEEVILTPYSVNSYAVYEPDSQLFYSTEDDYFDEMDTYIYHVDDLLFHLEDVGEKGSYYNSIIMPLLKSYNISVNEIVTAIYNPYSIMLAAEEELASCAHRGVYYYLQLDENTCYTNVESEQDILTMSEYYRFEKTADGKLEQTHSEMLPDAKNLYSIKDSFADFPVSTVFCFGFMDDNLMWESSATNLVQGADAYMWVKNSIYYIIALTIVSFLFLMVQAVWLIYTTGRRYKGDTEVKLNMFDRWYTEIWAVVIASLLVLSVIGALLVYEEAGYYSQSMEMIGICTVIGVLPFGFFFMMLTLSFARRLKAHNIWNRLLIVKLIKFIYNKIKNKDAELDGENGETKKSSAAVLALQKVWNRCKEAYYNIKGTRKLLLAFIIFVIVEIIIVFIGMNNDLYAAPAFVYFLLLQVLAVLALIWVVRDIEKLAKGVEAITKGNLDSKVEINEKTSIFGELADGVNHIGDGLKSAVETSLKDERMKTELITNVSHDLKTPLTSIINYVDLLKKQDMPNDDAKHYVEVLDSKAQRLKQLTEDLVEAAKATSGNIELEMMPLTFDELMKQALGEFEDKYEKKNLTIIASYPEEPAVVMADGRRLFRIIENVLQNIYKYAMEGTRVYADLSKEEGVVTFTLKNVSAAPLNISPDELMERFTRGDSSRTTDGSGLGLSIAKDLTRLQNGEFEIQLDGDLFKVIIRFPEYK